MQLVPPLIVHKTQCIHPCSFHNLNSQTARLCHSVWQKTICHNAFKGENIRQDENGNLLVTGFSKCTYDSNMVDLAMYFRRYLKKQQWDIEVIQKMFYAYVSENTLSLQDKKILLALFIYPEKFLSLCNEYYNKRRVCVSPAMLERMEVCIAGIDSNEKMIKWLETI